MKASVKHRNRLLSRIPRKSLFTWDSENTFLHQFIFPDQGRTVHTDLQVDGAEADSQCAALLTDHRPDLVDSAISLRMGVLPHHQ